MGSKHVKGMECNIKYDTPETFQYIPKGQCSGWGCGYRNAQMLISYLVNIGNRVDSESPKRFYKNRISPV